MSRILLIDGHPDADSLCRALSDAYAAGAAGAGATVDRLDLRGLRFDPHLHRGLHTRPDTQPLEPDLTRARELLVSADHVVVTTPVWWGSTPALLKGFLDRTLERGWAYRYQPNGFPEGFLRGRSARVLLTTDSPQWYLRTLAGDTTVKQLRHATLAFCGLRPVRVSRFGPVHGSTADRRTAWIERARRVGARDAVRRPAADRTFPPARAGEFAHAA